MNNEQESDISILQYDMELLKRDVMALQDDIALQSKSMNSGAELIQTLSEIREKITELEGSITTINERLGPKEEGNHESPWVFTLIREYSTGEDADGNGLIFGTNFTLNENVEDCPPVLGSAVIHLRENESCLKNHLTWEEYIETIKEPHYKAKVAEYVSMLGQKGKK